MNNLIIWQSSFPFDQVIHLPFLSRLLNHQGLSSQRPVYKSYKQNPGKVKAYLEEQYPSAIEQAKRYKAQLYFVDEAAVRSDSHRGTNGT